MDAGQIAELRNWARRLEVRTDDGELRAAGKAILLLVGEVERLQGDVGSPAAGAGAPVHDREPESEAEIEVDVEGSGDEPAGAEASLRSRLRRTFGYGGS